jgi:hypothetical protein
MDWNIGVLGGHYSSIPLLQHSNLALQSFDQAAFVAHVELTVCGRVADKSMRKATRSVTETQKEYEPWLKQFPMTSVGKNMRR